MTEADERDSSLPTIPDEEERVPSSLLQQHLINQERELQNESEELAIRRLEIDRSAEGAQAYIRVWPGIRHCFS